MVMAFYYDWLFSLDTFWLFSPVSNKIISIVYKVGIVLMTVLGILLQCGIGTNHFSFSSFRMFTTLSNCAVIAFYCVLHFKPPFSVVELFEVYFSSKYRIYYKMDT